MENNYETIIDLDLLLSGDKSFNGGWSNMRTKKDGDAGNDKGRENGRNGGNDTAPEIIGVLNDFKNIMPKTSQFSECRLDNGKTCMSRQMLNKLSSSAGVDVAAGDELATVSGLMKKTNCDSEKCVLVRAQNYLGVGIDDSDIDAELDKFKVDGPRDVTLLNNKNIDEMLIMWNRSHNDFFPYNFNMSNFKNYSIRNGQIIDKPDTLETIDVRDLYNGNLINFDGLTYEGPFKMAACVINTDTYQGRGKHWMALFIDMRDKDIWTVEFFNSSGNAPAAVWIEWLNKTKFELEALILESKLPRKVNIVRVCDSPQQKSKTECGVYSLFYIWARINGVPWSYFAKNSVPDQLMFMARGMFFHDSNFNWKYFNKLLENKKFIDDIAAANIEISGVPLTSKNIFTVAGDPHTRYELIRNILGIKKLAHYFEFDYNIYQRLTNIKWE